MPKGSNFSKLLLALFATLSLELYLSR